MATLFFGFAGLLVLVALIVGAFQAFTDNTVQPYIKVSQPVRRLHTSLEYLDARRKAFEVHIPLET